MTAIAFAVHRYRKHRLAKKRRGRGRTEACGAAAIAAEDAEAVAIQAGALSKRAEGVAIAVDARRVPQATAVLRCRGRKQGHGEQQQLNQGHVEGRMWLTALSRKLAIASSSVERCVLLQSMMKPE